MSTPQLPTHIGGYQHLAPHVTLLLDDIVVESGVPKHFVGSCIAYDTVEQLENYLGMNVYRRIPVAKQGDCDTSGWKKVKVGAGDDTEWVCKPGDEGAGQASLPAEDQCYGKNRGGARGGPMTSDVISHNEVARKQDEVVGSLVRAGMKAALPSDAKTRKQIPLYSGLLKYFPRALCAVAELSRIGNDQHNPGKPLHWDRSKSGDEGDALMRHLMEAGTVDSDGVRHATKVAWRGLALLEKELEGVK